MLVSSLPGCRRAESESPPVPRISAAREQTSDTCLECHAEIHAKLDQAECWFARRGALIVVLGRCVPGMRSLVSLPAGLLRMPRGRYLLCTLLGSAVWNALLVGAGYALGSQWERVSDVIGPISKPLIALVVVAAAGGLIWHGLRARRARTE